jgi:hypothetical protein
MTVDTIGPSVFDAGLPTIEYDLTATPAGPGQRRGSRLSD